MTEPCNQFFFNSSTYIIFYIDTSLQHYFVEIFVNTKCLFHLVGHYMMCCNLLTQYIITGYNSNPI